MNPLFIIKKLLRVKKSSVKDDLSQFQVNKKNITLLTNTIPQPLKVNPPCSLFIKKNKPLNENIESKPGHPLGKNNIPRTQNNLSSSFGPQPDGSYTTPLPTYENLPIESNPEYVFSISQDGSRAKSLPGTSTAGSIKLTGDLTASGPADGTDIPSTLTRPIDAGGEKITNVGTPIDPTDAASKGYVDSQTPGAGSIAITGVITASGATDGTDIPSTFTYPIDAGSNKITNVDTPTNAGDAANKAYVDSKVPTSPGSIAITGVITASGATDGTDIPSTFTYPIDAGSDRIVNVGTPIDPTDAVPKSYVDSRPLDAGNQKITNVGTPTDPTDAASKGYVDSQTPGAGTVYLTGAINAVASTDGTPTSTTFTYPIDAGNQKITNVGTPTDPTDAAPKSYVDSRPLDAGGEKITNVGTPIDPTDAASKGYVDSQTPGAGTVKLGGAITGEGLADGTQIDTILNPNLSNISTIVAKPDTGLTISSVSTNPLTISNTGTVNISAGNGNLKLTGLPIPTQDDQAASKSYTDTKAAESKSITVTGVVNINGSTGTTSISTFELPIDAGSNRIINAADPVSATDVATKGWVESQPGNAQTVTLSGAVNGSGSTGSTIPTTFSDTSTFNTINVNTILTSALPFNFQATNSSTFNFAGVTQILTDGLLLMSSSTNQVQIHGLEDPTQPRHAAHKQFVENSIANNEKDITLAGDVTASGKTGETINTTLKWPMVAGGVLNMNGYNIVMGTATVTDLPTPTNSTDAAPKGWVESYVDSKTLGETITRTNQVQTWDYSSSPHYNSQTIYKIQDGSSTTMEIGCENQTGDMAAISYQPGAITSQWDIYIKKSGVYYYPLRASYEVGAGKLQLSSYADEMAFEKVGGASIIGLKEPTVDSGAVNKGLLDQSISNIMPNTGWTSFTMDIKGEDNISNPTKAGNIIHDKAQYMIIGKMMTIMYYYYHTTSGSAGYSGLGTYRFTIPNGYTIDTSVMPAYNSSNSWDYMPVGSGFVSYDNGSAYGLAEPFIYDGTTLGLSTPQYSYKYVGSAHFALYGTIQISYRFTAQIPIV